MRALHPANHLETTMQTVTMPLQLAPTSLTFR